MTTITRWLLIATCLLFSTFSFGQYRIYVNAAATGNNNGACWYDAFTDLQTALSAAALYGDEIWVAKGTYYPTTTTDRDIYFELKNRVKLYGGFTGVETQLSERDWTANETVLSGDIGVVGDSTDNSYNILFIGKSDTTTIVDGFVFRDGKADGPLTGSAPNQRYGAAIQIFADQFVEAYPKIHNCKFEHNSASSGGAVGILAHYINGSAGPHFENCLFRHNSADIQGGAIYRSGHSSLEIKDDFLNCTFENNSGDAIYYNSYNPKKDIFEVVGCNFISNQGGGIRIDEQSGNKNEGKIEIRDCNFTGNQRIMGAGLSISAHPLSISIINSSFIENSNTNILTGNGSAMLISYNSSFPVGVDSFNLDVSQCIFKDNSSNYFQPIISLDGNGSDADVFTKLFFRDNLFEKNTDGIDLRDFNSNNISNCIFEGNGTQEDRYILDAYLTHKVVVTNSIFTNNKGILFREDNSNATDTISNCTFYNNFSLVDTASSEINGSAFISNCIFSQETQGIAFPIEAANVTLENSLILSPDCSALPAFVTCGPGNIYGLEPMFADTAAGDFHLLPTSPGTGTGDNNIVNELGILTDLDGNPRIQGGTVDMEAYESDSGSNNLGVKYVNTNVQGGNNDGTSWANAYLDLQDALAASQYGDEIWVAQGTYYPTSTTDRNISFELKNGVKLYGGFVGTETQLGQRDWVANETVLSGDIGVVGDSTDNTFNVIYCNFADSTTMVDGFSITNGNANIPIQGPSIAERTNSGGGMYIIASSNTEDTRPIIINCKFISNNAVFSGGGIYMNSKSNIGFCTPFIKNCLFQNNSAYRGGAMRKEGGSLHYEMFIESCFFKSNNAIDDGGGIYLSHSSPNGNKNIYIKNCDFVDNLSTTRGGAISHDRNNTTAVIKVVKCNFERNKSPVGSAIGHFDWIEYNTMNIDSCIFESNESSYGTIALTFAGLLELSNSIFRNNIGNSGGSCLDIRDSDLLASNCSFEKSLSQSSSSTINIRTFSTLTPSSVNFINCTFFDNKNSLKGTINCTNPQAQVTFGNSIFNDNDLNSDGQLITFSGDELRFSYCLIDISDCTSISNGPVTCGPGMLYNLNPKFVDPDNGDLHLSPCSPARNAGNNDIVNSLGILTDIDGSPRIMGGTVDMGAYESPAFGTSNVAIISQACGPTALGTIALTLANGCPPYFLDWGVGSTISDTSNIILQLPVGSYTVTITDGRMESDTVNVAIAAAPAITANAIAFPINCATGTGGSASVEAIGGTGNFSFLWSSGGNTAAVTGLAEGTYTVTVTDASGCTATGAATIATSGNLTLGINIHPITCAGDSDGTATVQPIGGVMPYTWLWQGGQTTPTLDSLSGGSYSATVTDALGCTGDIDFTINPPTVIDINIEVLHPACFGNPGLCIATASGGTGSFSYLWDNGATTATAVLPIGPHSVTVTDANGCTAIGSATIPTPPLLELNLNAVPPLLCHGEADASITVTPTGGTPPYDWGGNWVNLAAGTYTVTVYDANICSATATVTIPELPDISTTATVTNASSAASTDGSVNLTTVTGGTGGGYLFLWNNGSTAQNLTGLPTGDYTVTITDAHGCTGVFSFHVDFETASGETAGNPFGAAIVPNPSGGAGANLLIKNRLNGIRYAVLDALGREIVAEQNIVTEKQPLPSGLAAGSYFIVLKYAEGKVVLKWMVIE